MISLRRRAVLGVGLTAWLVLTAAGFAYWEHYEATPGSADPLTAAPIQARGGWELVLFAHPHCPCTRASLAELAELSQQAGPRLEIRVVFIQPEGTPAGWERTELWATAAAIPGVRVSSDPDGVEARKCGAITSGQVVLYDATGRVAFYGGLTRARGRVGESAARQTILNLLAGHESTRRDMPVFGCALSRPDACFDREKTTPCPQ
jgi:hypothetical protein